MVSREKLITKLVATRHYGPTVSAVAQRTIPIGVVRNALEGDAERVKKARRGSPHKNGVDRIPLVAGGTRDNGEVHRLP